MGARSTIATSMTMKAGRAVLRVSPAGPDDRWRDAVRGTRRLSALAIAILVASLALHAVLVVIALFGARAETVPSQEIPVEVVQELPSSAQTRPVEPEAAKPPLAKPSPPQPSDADRRRADLENQLAELKAEQQALKADGADLGPLRDSIRAVALPSEGAEGELVGYQALVFSQLAKAKEGAREAAHRAVVGVRFSVDENGALLDAMVAVSSGVAGLDEEALAIVRRAAPFPKPPSGAERTFSANFAYAGVQP